MTESPADPKGLMNRRMTTWRGIPALGAVLSVLVAGLMMASAGMSLADSRSQGSTGTLSFNPTSGTAADAPFVTTSAGCPTDTTGFDVRLSGPRDLDHPVVGSSTSGFSTTAPFTAHFGLTFADAAAADSPPKRLTSGTYTVTLTCTRGSRVQGRFIGTVVFGNSTDWSVPGSTTTPTTPTTTDTTTTDTTTTTTDTTTVTCTTSPTATDTTTSGTTATDTTTTDTTTPTTTETTSPTTSVTPTTSPTATTTTTTYSDCSSDDTTTDDTTTDDTTTSDSAVTTTVAPTTTAPPSLAYTGAPLAQIGYLGFGLIAAGVVLVLVARRRASR